MESERAFHHDNSRKFPVSYACTSDACGALETRRLFVTERRKKEAETYKPTLLCLGNEALCESRKVHRLFVFKIKFPYNARSDWLKQRTLSDSKEQV